MPQSASRRMIGLGTANRTQPPIVTGVPVDALSTLPLSVGTDPGVMPSGEVAAMAKDPGHILDVGNIIGGGGGGGESVVGSMIASYFCWVAAIYFPRDSQDWWDARNWLAEGWTSSTGIAFRRWYEDHGEQWALELQEDESQRIALYPFFELCRMRGAELRRKAAA